MTRPCRRPAFTLIELLIVIAVISVLVALLLSAVERARESANRASCSSNLKMLGLAATNYDSMYGHLPPGYLGPSPSDSPFDVTSANGFESLTNTQFSSGFVNLLPFLEADTVADAMVLNTNVAANDVTWVSRSQNWQASQTLLQIFRCPSDDPYSASNGPFVMEQFGLYTDPNGFFAEYYISLDYNSDPTNQPARSNYLGVGGYMGKTGDPGIDLYEGMFYNRSTVKLSQVSGGDGTSNTLMYGEALGDTSMGPRTYCHSWMGCGALPTAWGLPNPPQWYSFGSKHPGGIVQFCFGDGAVQQKTAGVDSDVFIKLSGWHDGAVVDPNAW